jgi:hypothetical protein
VGHALLFAVGAGPPHDGIRKADVSICFTTLPRIFGRLSTLNEIVLPFVPTGTILIAGPANSLYG